MLTRNSARVGAVCLTIVVLALHCWLLWSLPIPRAVGVLSFALLCIFLSFALDRLLSLDSRQSTAEPNSARPGSFLVMDHWTESPVAEHNPSAMVNAFSIDLEDYFHTEVASQAVHYVEWDQMPSRIRSSVSRLLDVLDENGTRSTVFVLGWVARKFPSLVREVADRGHEIACHSDRHRAVFRLDRRSLYEDTRVARESIEDAVGQSIAGYRAPSFSITPGTEWAFDVLQELGFTYDSSVNPVRHPFYGNPRAQRHPYYVANGGLLEIPVATWRLGSVNLPVGGGAYLRLLPYSYMRAGLAWINHVERMPFTLYMHPWEIDGFQPTLNLDWKSRARQTWGIATMEARLSRLLTSFGFAPICEVYDHLLAPHAGVAASRPHATELLPEMVS